MEALERGTVSYERGNPVRLRVQVSESRVEISGCTSRAGVEGLGLSGVQGFGFGI
jgi:hypothetical protein